MCSVEAQSETAAIAIRCASFFVENLELVGFTDNKNKLFTIHPHVLPSGVTYILFRSITNRAAIGTYAPDCSLFLEFDNRLR